MMRARTILAGGAITLAAGAVAIAGLLVDAAVASCGCTLRRPGRDGRSHPRTAASTPRP